MSILGDDHPDGPDIIRDLTWMTALHGLTKPQEELPEELLFERPVHHPGFTGFDQKMDAVLRREAAENDCE